MIHALSASVVDQSLIVAVELAAATLAFFVARHSVKLAACAWICVLCFVPIWFGVGIGFNGNVFLPASSAIAAIVILALVPAPAFRFSTIDGLVTLLVIASLVSLFAGRGGIALSFVVSLIIFSVIGYLLGRILPFRVDLTWIYGAIGVAFTVVAVLAIVEFATGWNVFVHLPANNALFALWSPLQERGGLLRVEGAFGQSIALGASLAIAIPLTLASRFRLWIRSVMVVLMLVATVFTFSRIGMVCALLGLVLSVLFLRDAISRRTRIALTSAIVALSLALFPFVTTVFDDAGTEASGSAAYRGDLLSLLNSMNIVGLADSAQRTATGVVYFGTFRSIDSELILTGLSSGVLALAAIVLALVVAVVLVLRGRASAATIALVAQIPAFATVALITQYGIFAWFLVGLAAASELQAKTAGLPATERAGISSSAGTPNQRIPAP